MDIKLGGCWSWDGHSGEDKTKMVHLEQYKLMAYGVVEKCTDCRESLIWCRACVLKGYSGLGMQQGCSTIQSLSELWKAVSGEEGQLGNQGTDGKAKCRMTPPNCSVRKIGVLRQDTRVMGGKIRGDHGPKTGRSIIRRR